MKAKERANVVKFLQLDVLENFTARVQPLTKQDSHTHTPVKPRLKCVLNDIAHTQREPSKSD